MELKEQILEQLNGFRAELQTAVEAKALTTVEAKMKELQTSLETLITKAGDASKTELKTITDQATELKTQLTTLNSEFEAYQLKFKAGGKQNEVKTFGTAIGEAFEEKHDEIMKFMRKEKKSLEIELKAVADQSTDNISGGSVWGAVYKPGIITLPGQIGHVRNNIIPVTNAGPGTDSYFMREADTGEGAPAFTAEKKAAAATNVATGLKPQFDIDLVEASVKFETVAGWMPISRKAINNIKSFLAFLQMRVPEKLWDVEDEAVLYGDGASPNIKGVLATGNFVAGSTTASTLVERIIDDIANLEDTYKRVASGIALRPLQYHSFFKQKAGGSGEYDLPANVSFVNGVLYISGIPVTKTTALHSGDYLISAAMGAVIEQQEAMRLEFFEQDGTNVRTNQTTLRVEETIALPVYGSTFFVKGEVPA